MSRTALLMILVFGSTVSYGQNISVTFTGTGAATQIDSVKATNLRTNQSVALPGNETLVLTVNTGIPSVSELTDMGIVYPNPFSGRATFSTVVQKPQSIYLKVQNFVGQVVAQTKVWVQPGDNEFDVSVTIAGIYMVTLTTDQGAASYKVICTDASESENRIQYLGSGSNIHNNLSQIGLKSAQTAYTLGYTLGDIIHYRCKSGIFTTIMTDSPTSSKNYDVEFAACSDPDAKNYSIVKIGTQTWMAENLAYLPSVGPSNTGSGSLKHYYVYGYQGTDINEAKAMSNYTIFGVLYNWPAAMDGASSSNSVPSGVQGACPQGWHLPSDEEWKILEKNLGMNNYDANTEGGQRNSGYVGRKLREAGTTHWISPNTYANNYSGFTALPGGGRGSWSFDGLGYGTFVQSASEYDASFAWNRFLGYDNDGVGRSYGYKRDGYSVRCVKD